MSSTFWKMKSWLHYATEKQFQELQLDQDFPTAFQKSFNIQHVSLTQFCFISIHFYEDTQQKRTFIHLLLAILTMDPSITRAEPSHFRTLRHLSFNSFDSVSLLLQLSLMEKMYMSTRRQEIVNNLPVSESKKGFMPSPLGSTSLIKVFENFTLSIMLFLLHLPNG